MGRRQVLAGGAALAAVLATGRMPAAVAAPMPPIHRRAAWTSTPPTGPLAVEEDVRFALVHHTASSNGYAPEDVPDVLRGILAFHTSPSKGWPDIAYNLLVDRYGGIWEGREGSVDRVVRGDATGGSQGFAVLCCLIGDLQAAPPTAAAQDALVALLAWLLAREGIDPQGSTTFTSRGSNRHPAGTTVTTPTITGHRTMSTTACPGDHGMALVTALPALVAEVPPGHFRRAGGA
jgi:hypothetical protein